jgi:DNA-binding response OmpR family regulator
VSAVNVITFRPFAVNNLFNEFIKAIELGLVKYLVKPVCEKEFEEALLLCVDSLENSQTNVIQLDDKTTFDMFNKNLIINDEIIKLRTKELVFLELLLKNKNRYVSYSEIENFVWDDSVMTKDALKTLVKNLKTKIPKNLILNLTNSGYKINV